MTSFDDAFRRDIMPSTGGWSAESSTVKRCISQLTRNAASCWIGIASNGRDGCRARWNSKYKGLGMSNMAAVYTTTSDHFRKALEEELIDYYGSRLDNMVGGGGGGSGTPPYTVYVAWD